MGFMDLYSQMSVHLLGTVNSTVKWCEDRSVLRPIRLGPAYS